MDGSRILQKRKRPPLCRPLVSIVGTPHALDDWRPEARKGLRKEVKHEGASSHLIQSFMASGPRWPGGLSKTSNRKQKLKRKGAQNVQKDFLGNGCDGAGCWRGFRADPGGPVGRSGHQ